MSHHPTIDNGTDARVRVQLLGGFQIDAHGVRSTPGSIGRRDPVRLAALLALAPGRQLHREQVLDALWPDADLGTVANRLHKASHFLRKATDNSRAIVVAADTLALFPDDDVFVDARAFDEQAVVALDSGDAATIDAALALYRGDLLPFDLYEDWTFHHRQRLQLRYRELLRLGRRYDRLVAIDPTDEDGHVGAMRAMLDRGDRAGVVRQFDLLCEILERELGVGPSVEARALRDLAVDPMQPVVAPTSSPPRAATLATQRVQFCTTADGVRLASAKSGSGPPLVKASNWLTHLDHDWASPVWSDWWQELSARYTLIRYDERGCGLSDWDVDADSFTLDAWVHDLETVVDALGLERFPLFGMSQGGPIAITYAARHPERVSHVIVYGTCARATWDRADDERRRELAALGELIKLSWGSDEPAFRQVYNARFMPDGPIEQWRAFDELQRRSTSPRNAHRLWRAFGSLDCSEAARSLDVPTLILHASDDRVWSFEEAEELQAMVAGSELVALDSSNHILQSHEPAFAVLLEEIEHFLQR